jgi:hypothetical protein
MRYMPVLLLLITMPALAANVWKWRDASGVVHYSDQPVPGAEQVSGLLSNSYAAPAINSTSNSSASAAVAPITYTNVEIWKPSQELTVANTGGQVSVGVRVEPALAQGHRLALYMDGRLVPGFPEQGMEYDLANVERGAHTLVLTVIDAQGKRVTESAPVQFFVQQVSVLNRPASGTR